MKTVIRRMGNSQGVILPKALLEELGAKANDPVELKVKKGKIVISPLPRDPRERWAEESKQIAAAGEGGLVWPEFPNKDDENWKW